MSERMSGRALFWNLVSVFVVFLVVSLALSEMVRYHCPHWPVAAGLLGCGYALLVWSGLRQRAERIRLELSPVGRGSAVDAVRMFTWGNWPFLVGFVSLMSAQDAFTSLYGSGRSFLIFMAGFVPVGIWAVVLYRRDKAEWAASRGGT